MIPTLNDIRYGFYGLLIGAAGGIAGLTILDPSLFTDVQTVTVAQYIVKKEEVKTAKKITIKKKKTKPNGATETTTTTIDEKTDTAATTTMDTKVASTPAKAKYSVGANIVYRTDILNTFSYKDIRLDVGVRLGDTPVWLEGNYQFNNTWSLGARLEF